MKQRKPKKYVKVNLNGFMNIYECYNYNYMIIDNRLYLRKNLDTTETLARNVYEDLGEVLCEEEELK